LNFSRWITETWAQEYRDELIRLSNTPTKMDWSEELTRLKGIKERLDRGASLAELRAEEE